MIQGRGQDKGSARAASTPDRMPSTSAQGRPRPNGAAPRPPSGHTARQHGSRSDRQELKAAPANERADGHGGGACEDPMEELPGPERVGTKLSCSHRRRALPQSERGPTIALSGLVNGWQAGLSFLFSPIGRRRSVIGVPISQLSWVRSRTPFSSQNGGSGSGCSRGSSRGRPGSQPDRRSLYTDGGRAPLRRAPSTRRPSGTATLRAAVRRALGSLPRRPRGAAAPGRARLHRGQLRTAQRGRGAGHRDAAG